jgi:hypothetical protein
VILQTARSVEPVFNVVCQLLAMNVFAERDHIRQAESDLCCPSMFERQHFCTPIALKLRGETIRFLRKINERRVLDLCDFCFGLKIVLEWIQRDLFQSNVYLVA